MADRRNTETGKIAEMRFNVECAERGWTVSWPSIDNKGYDCIVDNGKRLFKVQIKSSILEQVKGNNNPFYKFQVRRGKDGRDHYTQTCFDILAIYLHPRKTWYIMERKDLLVPCVCIYVNSTKSRYVPFKENWQLLE
jgi:hypothetical protein